jgi:hypothetical protein
MPNYRYEVYRGVKVIATGRMTREQPLEVGQPITIVGHPGRVLSIDPLLHERELRVVIQLRGGDDRDWAHDSRPAA